MLFFSERSRTGWLLVALLGAAMTSICTFGGPGYRSLTFMDPVWVGNLTPTDVTEPPMGGSYDLLAGFDPDYGKSALGGDNSVSDWTNKWGSMTLILTNHITTTSSKPKYRANDTSFNNKGSFTFLGSAQRLQRTNDAVNTWGAPPYTIYVAALMTNATLNTTLFDGGVVDTLRLRYRTTAPGRLYLQNNTTDQMGVILTNALTLIAAVINPSAGSEYYVTESNNDTAVTKGPPLTGEDTTDPDGFVFGARGNGSSANAFTGRLGRVYIYRGAHDQTQRDAVLTSLNEYYAVY